MTDELKQALVGFFFPKEQVHQHWYSLVDDLEYVTDEFYALVEKELELRKVPGLEVCRIDLSEGGPLSPKREYLRLKRERLVFDICAAPFGTAYFFSLRFVELPLGIKPWELLVCLTGLALVSAIAVKVLGTLVGCIALVVLVGATLYVMRNAVALGLKDLDAAWLGTPVLGPLYELLIRKETYYREDTRLMYVTTVDRITTALVEQVTTAKGIKLGKRFYRKPKGGDVFEERITSLEEREPPPDTAA